MGVIHHSQEAFWRDEQLRPPESLPKHGILTKEGAVLFGTINAEVVPNKVPQSLALPTSEDDPPQGALWRGQFYSPLLPALWQHPTNMAWEEATLACWRNLL
jgi:hypothetical protein